MHVGVVQHKNGYTSTCKHKLSIGEPNPFIQLPGAGQVPCLMNDIENGKLPIIHLFSIVICQQAKCCKCMTQWCIATASSSCLFFCSKWRSIQGVVQRFSAGQPTASYFLLKQL